MNYKKLWNKLKAEMQSVNPFKDETTVVRKSDIVNFMNFLETQQHNKKSLFSETIIQISKLFDESKKDEKNHE